jgi:hypothetical protein
VAVTLSCLWLASGTPVSGCPPFIILVLFFPLYLFHSLPPPFLRPPSFPSPAITSLVSANAGQPPWIPRRAAKLCECCRGVMPRCSSTARIKPDMVETFRQTLTGIESACVGSLGGRHRSTSISYHFWTVLSFLFFWGGQQKRE